MSVIELFITKGPNDTPEMFDGGANPAFLKTLNIRGSEDSGQVRVLGEGLKALSDGVNLGRWRNERRPHPATEGVLGRQGVRTP